MEMLLILIVDVGAGHPPLGAAVIAYKFGRGPYKEVGPLFTEVCTIAPDNKCLGIYYDDPKKVEANRLRRAVGCVLAEGDEKVDENMRHKFEKEGFKIISLPYVENAVCTKFPYISIFSIFIAVSKVYPKLGVYIEEHKLCAHPFLEIYDGKMIRFMAPLSKQQEFYVPESLKRYPGEVPYESYYYTDEPSLNVSQSDLSTTFDESQSETSLLDSPKCTGKREKKEDEEGTAGSPTVGGSAEKELNGSDEESTSSFEEVKMDNSDVPASQP
nr:hypothetical protein BaRGS_002027 [Batillaria attramentaria]